MTTPFHLVEQAWDVVSKVCARDGVKAARVHAKACKRVERRVLLLPRRFVFRGAYACRTCVHWRSKDEQGGWCIEGFPVRSTDLCEEWMGGR
jgi:hypothetical protein